MNRRRFLKLSAVGTTTVFLGACAGGFPIIPERPDVTLKDASSWISFDGRKYQLAIPRAELGQNISTTLKQIAMVELGVDWEQIHTVRPDTNSIPGYRATVGSESIQDYAIPLAMACATLRDYTAAGQTGVFRARPRPTSNLRSFAKNAIPAPKNYVDTDSIVFGAPLYTADTFVPNVHFGRVVRSGLSPELYSRPTKIDSSKAQLIPGFVAVIESEKLALNASIGVGIVAKTPGALDAIEEALFIDWETEVSRQAPADGVKIAKTEDTDDASYHIKNQSLPRPKGPVLGIEITTPPAAHAPIEPHNCVARVEDGILTVSVSSQDPFFVRDFLAEKLNWDAEKVIVKPNRVGGGFGGKVIPLVEIEAAVLAQETGKPVKVQWTRAQTYQYAYHRPPTTHRLQMQFIDGKITAWDHHMKSGHVIFSNAILPPWVQRFTDFIGDDGTARNLTAPYNFQSTRIGYDLERLEIRTSAWRGLGAGPNALAIEVAIEAAAKLNARDPVDYRLEHMDDPRLKHVLERVSALAGNSSNSFRGVGCGIYKGISYGAVIAEAELSIDGRPKITKIWCAHDCGRVMNSDQVRAQCEGNIAWALGMILYDQLSIESGFVQTKDFVDSPLPTLADFPQVEIELIDSNERPVGAGETLMASAPAAIANAIIALTGSLPGEFPIKMRTLT